VLPKLGVATENLIFMKVRLEGSDNTVSKLCGCFGGSELHISKSIIADIRRSRTAGDNTCRMTCSVPSARLLQRHLKRVVNRHVLGNAIFCGRHTCGNQHPSGRLCTQQTNYSTSDPVDLIDKTLPSLAARIVAKRTLVLTLVQQKVKATTQKLQDSSFSLELSSKTGNIKALTTESTARFGSSVAVLPCLNTRAQAALEKLGILVDEANHQKVVSSSLGQTHTE